MGAMRGRDRLTASSQNLKVTTMAVTDRTTLAEIAKTYAAAVQAEPAAKQLWARSHRDYIELWLVTELIEPEVERQLYGAESVIYDRFPDAYIRLHVLNPRYFEPFDLSNLLPPGVEEIPLRPA
jgi:hypothetical protein